MKEKGKSGLASLVCVCLSLSLSFALSPAGKKWPESSWRSWRLHQVLSRYALWCGVFVHLCAYGCLCVIVGSTFWLSNCALPPLALSLIH